jgi:MPBQ/MSBQ methyltransferase
MNQPKAIAMSPTTRYQNAALSYYLALTDSPYLHYGYWEPIPAPTDELTLTRFRSAQEAYAAKLFGFIPEGIKSVLDVGCGIGGNAVALLDRGFSVEGLAPDAFQQERFLNATQDRAKFYLTRFEDFQSTYPYDLILMSESSQYMDTADIASSASKLLKTGGYLLLADMMRSDAGYTKGIFSNCHIVQELHESLKKAGFSLAKTEDISAQVAPTLDLCVSNFRTFGLSTFQYIADVLAIAVPPLFALLRWAANRWAKEAVVEGLAARNIFDAHLCYKIQLWQKS